MRAHDWGVILAILAFVVGTFVLTMRGLVNSDEEASPVTSPTPTHARSTAQLAPVDPRAMIGHWPSKEVHSPEFETDGIAFRLTNAWMYRQALGGLIWTAVSFPVGQVAFAPVSGPERPIFATVTSNGFPPLTLDRRPRPTDDHVRSIGVVVSRDGGASWQPTSGQPEIDGVPYRHVQEIIISPTYALDQTIAAFAWGPMEPVMRGPANQPVRPAALFLSRDAGATWAPIWKPSPNISDFSSDIMYASPLRGHIALSRSFNQDHRVILITSGGLTPGSSFCSVLSTANGGQSWVQLVSGQGYGAYSSCNAYPGGTVGYSSNTQPQTVTVPATGDLFVDSEGHWRPLPLPPLPRPTPGPASGAR